MPRDAAPMPHRDACMSMHAGRMHIRDWPEGERPREKLLAHGAGSLSDAELLAIFLGSGRPGAMRWPARATCSPRKAACAPCWIASHER
jgi:hypothetical protein